MTGFLAPGVEGRRPSPRYRVFHGLAVFVGDDLAAIASLIMMRRIAIMAWFGTHPDTTLAQDHRDPFPAETCEMAEAYLSCEPSADNIIPWA